MHIKIHSNMNNEARDLQHIPRVPATSRVYPVGTNYESPSPTLVWKDHSSPVRRVSISISAPPRLVPADTAII